MKIEFERATINNVDKLINIQNQSFYSDFVKDNNDITYFLSGICVVPDCKNHGIGQEAIKFIENQFSNAKEIKHR